VKILPGKIISFLMAEGRNEILRVEMCQACDCCFNSFEENVVYSSLRRNSEREGKRGG
jgi:hypothetical protein